MAHHEHKKRTVHPVQCAVLTVSDTRTEETDGSGKLIRELLHKAGHQVSGYEIVPDDPERIRSAVERLAAVPGCHAILITGGTGIAPRDQTYEAVAGLLEKRLDGFGELFRMLSFPEIGPTAMLSRAVAGIYAGRIVFVMPGSTAAVRLALERLILPELGHAAHELGRPEE